MANAPTVASHKSTVASRPARINATMNVSTIAVRRRGCVLKMAATQMNAKSTRKNACENANRDVKVGTFVRCAERVSVVVGAVKR